MKTLLVFALLQANLHLTFADWQHPHYSYRCLENGSVVLFGVHSESSIKVEKACTQPQQNKTSGFYWIQFSCLTKQTGGYSANISVYDKVFDGTTTPPPSNPIGTTTPPKVVGGHGGHKFVITCKDIPDAGINRTVAHVFQGKDYNKLPDNYKEVSDVEMRFKAVNNTAAPDISTIYIGDEFYMFIEYMGEQSYKVIPEECTAFGETWISKGLSKSGHSVDLWNIDKYSENDTKACVEHEELLGGFGIYNETIIYTKMYGFRFTDKEYVTITCEVKIFKSISVSDETNLCMDITSSRRKRNIENVPFQTQALTKRLRVFDNKDVYLAENKGHRIKWETTLWMMIFATVTLHTWLADS